MEPARLSAVELTGMLKAWSGGDASASERLTPTVYAELHRLARLKGIEDLGLFRVVGQPNYDFIVDRDLAARYQINVADVQDAIQTAVGGSPVTQVWQGERRYDVVPRYLAQYRNTKDAIEDIRLLAPSGERVSLAQLCKVKTLDGASKIDREANSRYVALKYSVRGATWAVPWRRLFGRCAQVKLPAGYKLDWA